MTNGPVCRESLPYTYLPLALRVSASLLTNDDTLPVEHYLERLADERTRLAQLRDPDDPELDVEASLQLSYNALDRAAQSTLCQLSVFLTSFTLAAATAVVKVAGDIDALVGRLRRRNLLEWDASTSRYSLHDLVRVLAMTQLGDQKALQQRYFGWNVVQAQALYEDWSAAEDSAAREASGELYRRQLEQLWALLADDLRMITRGWIHANMESDSEKLALHMFGNIVFSLPKLQIDPQRNVRNLLLTIARHSLIDDYRRSHSSSGQRQATLAVSIDTQPDLVDPESAQIEERIVRRLDDGALLKAVWQYWRNSLIPVDYEIMKLRWRSDPPSPFSDIAMQLGPGWEEATVRQRHHLIMRATRKYLREQGLLDDEATQSA
jgi:hypothetical protein